MNSLKVNTQFNKKKEKKLNTQTVKREREREKGENSFTIASSNTVSKRHCASRRFI